MKSKTIDGFDSYAVSDAGVVTRLDVGRALKPVANKAGYLKVGLRNGTNQKWFFVARLVAAAFIPNPDNKPQINHIDGNKTNNHVGNLEWVTRKENCLHARRSLGKCVGEKNGGSKLTENDVIDIRTLRSFGAKYIDLAKAYGVGKTTVHRVLSHSHWRHI